jgi:glyoxylase-like metal-dependent hydrolase (beta-lactamase superfamily II)
VLVVGFPAVAFGTNCFVLAPAAGEECVVVDPGFGVAGQLEEVLREHRLLAVAVLLTHGHLDHTFSVAPVCAGRGISAYIHPADEPMLADPSLGLSAETAAMVRASGLTYVEPDDVVQLDDAGTLSLAGLTFTVDHAPGHTPGSVLFRLPDGPDERSDQPVSGTVLSGDVLFAGSIGRTDLPGGDTAAMMHSLATKVLPLDDDALVLPGHGPATTIGRERATNPYLLEAARTARSSTGSGQ